MIKIFLSVFIMMLAGNHFNFYECKCRRVPESETTYQGQAHIVVSDERIVNKFRGIVSFNDEPAPEALIEVFDDPEVVLLKYSPEIEKRRKNQRRIVACKTVEGGKFCFDDLPSGKYELRVSKSGFSPVSYIINFNPHHQSLSKEIEVALSLSN